MKRLSSRDANFAQALAEVRTPTQENRDKVKQIVADIIAHVRSDGDKAVLYYAKTLDHTEVAQFTDLRVPEAKLQAAWEGLDKKTQHALQVAHDRIAAYGEHQKLQSWSYTDADGSELGQQITPLDSVGIYVPGGQAAYPSSVMMNAIPAKVAGVPRIVMVVPTPGGVPNPLVLATAYLCGVSEVWQIGGAHAIAALAYGTESFPPVDKITGPGNQFVAEAKRMVFGQVGIDMIAGPSEVVVIADSAANPDWVVADLFAQAEHDQMAQSIFLTDSEAQADAVLASIEKMLPEQPRKEVIAESWKNRGAVIVCPDIAACVAVANDIAPEHLELMVEQPEKYVSSVHHAGAIFVGVHSNEVFGDYCAGPNHVLPTSRTARFASPLGVYDFQKRSSVLKLSDSAAKELAPIADLLAQGEGLYAHALSARLRGE